MTAIKHSVPLRTTFRRTQPRILVVEDSDTLRELVCTYFHRSGFSVSAANCGESALIRVASESLDCVLTDVEMPGIDGLELCRKIGALGVVLPGKLPVWIMTGCTRPAIETEALAVGAVGIFRKPFEIGKVVEAIRGDLEAAARQEDVRAGIASLTP